MKFDEHTAPMKPDDTLYALLMPDGSFYPRYENVSMPSFWYGKEEAEFLGKRVPGSRVVVVRLVVVQEAHPPA